MKLKRVGNDYSHSGSAGEYLVRNVGQFHLMYAGTGEHWQVDLNGHYRQDLSAATLTKVRKNMDGL